MTARTAGSGSEKIVTVVEVALVDGVWEYTDLNFGLTDVPRDEAAPAGGPGPPRKIAPFASPHNGLAAVRLRKGSLRVYYVDVYGGIIEFAVESGELSYRNVTSACGAPVAGRVSPLAVTESGGLAVHYVDTDGRLCRLWHKDGGWSWYRYGGTEAPAVSPASALAAMVTAEVSRGFVYYLDTHNRLFEVGWQHDKKAAVSDLSDLVRGLPALSPVGPLSAVGFGTDSRRVYFLDLNDNLVELAHTVGKPGQSWWSFANLATAAGAPVAREGSALVARLTTRSHTRAYYDGVDGDTVEVENSGTGWAPTTPGRLANDGACAPRAADTSALAAVLSADDVRNHVFYQDGDGHLIDLEWTGGRWVSRDLTAHLGLPVAAHASPLSAVFDGGPRAYYLSAE
ncbi:hypothetical protein [Streptomyces sp. NPDC093111]|uniref:hypothetical protein n=1 Tax=Streptomyces sp. NPDC093111 TaxID=3154978 RepID=UPI003423CC58